MTENAAGTSEATELTPAELTPAELTTEQEDVLEAMRDVVDPELGINVVDLGLVYGVDVDAERIATIDMTLTSAACPLTDVIEDQAREALDGVVADFRINWVWMPPWGPESITEDGREQLRALGFNIEGLGPDVEGLGVGRDPGVDLVRLVLARERDVDREFLGRHGRHGPGPHEGGALRHGGRRSRRVHGRVPCHRHRVAWAPRC